MWILIILAIGIVVAYHINSRYLYLSGIKKYLVIYVIPCILAVTLGSDDTSKYERELKRYYPDLKEVVSIKKAKGNADFKFTIIEYCGSGVTCKRDGMIILYEDGKISNVYDVGTPYDFKDKNGKEIHDEVYGAY